MSINSNINRVTAAGNGTTKAFAFAAPFGANTDLVVILRAADGTEATQALGTDYTVSGAGNPAGGTVTFGTAPASGATVVLYRDVPLTQPMNLQDGGPLPAGTANGAFDRITMQMQRVAERVDRGINLRDGDTPGSGRLDAGGNAIINAANAAASSGLVTLGQLSDALGSAGLPRPDQSQFIPVSDGIADAQPVIATALSTDAIVTVPTGTYRLANGLEVPGGKTLIFPDGAAYTGAAIMGDGIVKSHNELYGTGPQQVNFNEKQRFVNTPDSDAAFWLLNGYFTVATHGTNNGIVGIAVNDLAANTLAFPTGVTGVAYLKSAGNQAFAVYGEAHGAMNGVAMGGELDAFNDGAPAPTTYPFDTSIGTTQYLSKALNIGAGSSTKVLFTGTSHGTTTIDGIASTANMYVGQLVEGSGIPWGATIESITANSITISKAATTSVTELMVAVSPAACGIEITREGGTRGVFNFGITFSRDANLLWTLYQDADPTWSPLNGAYLPIRGEGVNLLLKTTAATVASNKMLDMQRADGTSMASFRQDGTLGLQDSRHGLARLGVGASSNVRGQDNVAAMFGIDDQPAYSLGAHLLVGSLAGNSPFIAASRYSTADGVASPLVFITDNAIRGQFNPTGGFSITGGGPYQIDGTKVVGPRDTGWTAMTGTPDESTSYATGTVTLAQLAGRVMALQAALTTHGLIGA